MSMTFLPSDGRLRDAVDGPVERPIKDNTRRLARQARIVLRRPHAKRGRGLLALRRVRRPRRRGTARANLLERDLAGREVLAQAARHERAVAALRRNREHGLLDGPIAGDVGLARRQAQRPLRRVHGRVRELIVAVDGRGAADRDALEIAGLRVVAVRVRVDVDVPARHELLRLPPRALDQRGRAHLAAHLERLAVGVDGLEVQIRMRIDELELRQRARVVLELLHLEQPEAVMRERRRRCGEGKRNRERGGSSTKCLSWHGGLLNT